MTSGERLLLDLVHDETGCLCAPGYHCYSCRAVSELLTIGPARLVELLDEYQAVRP